ncbi:MAG: tetratricopeptide repeat protein [Crocinitomix sp.]|nr:tetratricopeptide repeat protein [Crocinitomix sp.]
MKNKFVFFDKKWLLIFLLQICGYSASFAQRDRTVLDAIVIQNNKDTNQIKALLELYKIDELDAPEKAKTYLDQAMILAKNLDFERGKAETLLLYGNHYSAQGDSKMAEEALHKGKDIYESLNDQVGVANCLHNFGNSAVFQGNYEKALGYYLEAAQINQEIGDTMGWSKAQHNIGGMHYQLQQYDKALEYWEKSLNLGLAINDSIGIVYSLNAIGVVHTANKDYEKALEILQSTLIFANDVSGPSEMASILLNIGVQFQQLEALDSAKYYYTEALEIYKQIDEKYELAIQYSNLGILECDLEHGELAIAYFDSSITIAENLGAAHLLEYSYGGLADANKILGNYEIAFEWLEKWHDVKDSLTGETVQLNMNELQEKYEAELKDKEIAMLQKKEAEANLTADQRKWFMIIAITLLLSFSFILLLYLSRGKAKERQRRSELEQKALRAQMNPHFIFNSLGAIQQMYVAGEMDLANNYMGDFGSLMRKILDNSGKDLISVKEELDMLKLYLELEKGRNNDILDYAIDVDDNIDQLGTKIPPMIIQPFVENAIWHGLLPAKKKGKVIVRLKSTKKMNMLICEIKDNGVGIRQQAKRKEHESKGMKITEQRLGTKIRVENLSPGTCVTIKILI